MFSIFIGLSIMVAQAKDVSGDYLGLSGHLGLGLSAIYLGELVDIEFSRALLDALLVESWDSRRK